MKTASTDLFQLIKSLSKQEKRYFKLHASRHAIEGQNKYERLFDAIDGQHAYDETSIKKIFAGEAFIKQLHVAKNYLYKMILTSLRQYHETRSGDPFNRWMREAEILFDRGLFEQSDKIFQKAVKIAQREENFLQLLQASRWEHRIIHSRNDITGLENYVDAGLKKEFDLLEKYHNFLEFQALNDQVFIPYWKHGAVRKPSEKKALQQLFDRALFQSPDNARSFFAKYFYLNARFSYHLFIGEIRESYQYIRKLTEMFPKQNLDPKLVRHYISSLINLYIVQQQLRKFEEIPKTLAQLRSVPATSPEQKRRLLIRSINLETDFYIHTGQFAEGLKKIEPLLETSQKHLRKADQQQKLGLFYNLAYLYFGAGNFDKALDWINNLLQQPGLKTRQDIHSFSRLLNLIIHYELGNDELLEYIVKSTNRFLSGRKRLFKVEAVMLKLMRRYPQWLTPKEKAVGFGKLVEELKVLQKDEFEQKAFAYFNFIAWMESKISNKSFAEIINPK